MFESFGPDMSLKMDLERATTGRPSTVSVLEIKQEPEVEWPAELQTPPADLDVRTGSELMIGDKIERALKSELDDDVMELDCVENDVATSESEDEPMKLEEVKKNAVKWESDDGTKELEDDKRTLMESDSENDDVKAGLPVHITEVFTMRVNSGQTSSRNSDGRQGFKQPMKHITNDNVRFHMNMNKIVKLLTCQVCNYRTWKKESMKVHKATHLSNKPSNRGRRGPRRKEKHMKPEEPLEEWMKERPFACVECDYRASHEEKLKSHMRTHLVEKPHFCSVCGYRSKWKGNLTKHMSTHTEGKPPETTAHIGKQQHEDIPPQGQLPSINSVIENSEWDPHNETRDINDVRPFKCNECDHRASSNKDLVAHQRKHTGEKPFVCYICDYRSSWKGNWTKHMDTHTTEKLDTRQENQDSSGSGVNKAYREIKLEKNGEKDAPETLYICEVCGYEMCWKRDLMKHMAIHKVNEPLTHSSPAHTGKKKFVCHFCGYRTNRQWNLKTHLTTRHRDNVNLEQPERKNGIQLDNDRVDRVIESEPENTNRPAGTNNHKPCSVCFKVATVYKFRCESCRCFWNSWKRRGSRKPDCPGHTEEEDVDCSGCRWERYKVALAVWEEKHGSHKRRLKSTKGPIEPVLDQPQPLHDEMDRIIELDHEDMGVRTKTFNQQSCSVCFQYFPKVYKSRCQDCRIFWRYWTEKSSKPPDCPGHTIQGEDVDCPACRWERYKMASQAWGAAHRSDVDEKKDMDGSARSLNQRRCAVCFKSPSNKVFRSPCNNCRTFWSYWRKGSGTPPACPGHTTEGEDVDCPGCRWGRYKMVLISSKRKRSESENV